MWIPRDAAAHLVSLARQFPAVLVTGARQTGKTALLAHAFPAARFVTLDLPSAALAAETSPDDLLADTGAPLILDEVQYAPGLFRHIKARIDADRRRMGAFLMTGSQKFSLMEAVSDSLAGRCAILELGSLAATELAPLLELGADPAQVLWLGGYPELWRNDALQMWSFHSNYVATYLERDVRSAMRVASLRDFERFVRACALRSGQLLNLVDLARDVGIAGTTARDWLSVLQASDLVVLVEPWSGNAGKRLIKTPKLYFRDTGLLCFLLGLSSVAALVTSPFIGAVWETFVLAQMLAQRSSRGTPARLYFWRDVHGTEVDFLIDLDGRQRLVEAKWATQVTDDRAGRALLKVAETLGPSAADEHWIACRTPHTHLLKTHRQVRVMNAFTWTKWMK